MECQGPRGRRGVGQCVGDVLDLLASKVRRSRTAISDGDEVHHVVVLAAELGQPAEIRRTVSASTGSISRAPCRRSGRWRSTVIGPRQWTIPGARADLDEMLIASRN